MELTPKIVAISSLRGISDIKTSSGKVSPKMFSSSTRNAAIEGDYVGDYDGRPFLGAKQFLTPEWDNIRQRWFWEGDQTTFTRIVKSLDLRYPSNHPLAGQRVEIEDVESHLSNRRDPIFQNPEVISKFALKGGRGAFQMSNPLHEFLYHCLKGSRSVVDETGEDGTLRVNHHAVAGARFRFSASKKKNIQKRTNVERRLKASGLLDKMKANEARLRAICLLTNVPGYSDHTDINGMVVFLDEQIIQHGERALSRHGNAKFLDVFLSYAEMPNDRLKFEYEVFLAVKKGIVRQFPGGFHLQGEQIDGPSDFKQIVQYFSNEKNQDNYIKLLNYLNGANPK